jgi:thiamine biosynthesis protein ThiI
MRKVTLVLCTTSEISLKGGNRRWFERILTDNVRSALAGLPVAHVARPSWRILIGFSEPVNFHDVVRRLGTVFGIGGIMAAERAGDTLSDVRDWLPTRLGDLEAASFAIRCQRSDKRFPMQSPEIERDLGTLVQQHTGWPVDLKNPDLTIHVLIEDRGLYVWTRKIPGPGGLPVGVGGRACCLLSGGIDSPVAAHQLMKRGMHVDFVHFHSVPQTDPASLEKVEDLVRILIRYQGPARLSMVPLLQIQEQIAARCPAHLRILLYRRFMMRLAEGAAVRCRADALITGEALGQVASQTIQNVRTVNSVATLPVLRPLIGFDKPEIIDQARRIGTYETSIQPHFDCCSFLLPDSPATRSTPGELEEAERELDVDGLVDAALADAQTRMVDDPVGWDEIPLPKGVDP